MGAAAAAVNESYGDDLLRLIADLAHLDPELEIENNSLYRKDRGGSGLLAWIEEIPSVPPKTHLRDEGLIQYISETMARAARLPRLTVGNRFSTAIDEREHPRSENAQIGRYNGPQRTKYYGATGAEAMARLYLAWLSE